MFRFGEQNSRARQNNPEFGELAGLCVDLNRPAKVMINDANVVNADIETSNGIIHVIDRVILPPSN